MKFVLRAAVSRVPPTICLTWPAWMSMQPRNFVMVEGWVAEDLRDVE